MRVCSLELFDFRNYTHAELGFDGGLTAILGANGQGKTNLLEAIGISGGIGSIVGVPHACLVRQGADLAVVRCQVRTDNERDILIESEISSSGRNRFRLNKQNISRQRDLLGVFTLTVFAPADLMLVKGAPAERRRWIDDAFSVIDPKFGLHCSEMERILRQRNALLKQIVKKIDTHALATLDVWDDKLAKVGSTIRAGRRKLLQRISPKLNTDYRHMAGKNAVVCARYESSWNEEPLLDALAKARKMDIKRSYSTVGPHRDDIELLVDGMPARTHASQGEQRSLAIALRLAVDAEIRECRQLRTVVLLDDVFSELDVIRANALLEILPPGQHILTSTTAMLPDGAQPDQIIDVQSGTLSIRR